MAPQVALLLLGGVLADRYPRRRLLLVADGVRFVALAALAALALSDALELWHVIVLVAVYGCGEALFGPAFNSIVPELVPDEHLVQANALDQVVRPLALPAARARPSGGAIVGVAGAGAGVRDRRADVPGRRARRCWRCTTAAPRAAPSAGCAT